MSDPPTTGPDLVFESPKNRVVIYADRVVKTFKPTRRSARHARREIAALRRLQGIEGFPVLLDVSADARTLVLSRLTGVPLADCASITDSSLVTLRALVNQMLARGVARHSLPRRDIILDSDGSIGLVDFERSTQRLFPGDPVWRIARVVTRFNLLRLLNDYAPHLLTGDEQHWLSRYVRIRAALQRPRNFKRRVLRLIRRPEPDASR